MDQSMLGSRAGSIAGDLPEMNSALPYGQREAAISTAIQRLQQQQQQMMSMMNQEGMPAMMPAYPPADMMSVVGYGGMAPPPGTDVYPRAAIEE